MKNKLLFIILTTLILLSITSCKNTNYIYTEYDNYYEYIDVSYGKHKRQILDFYLPKNTSNKGVILFIHGGSWVSGDKEGYRNDLKYWCEQKGYASCAINYRYISGNADYNDILDDITNSLSKIKEIAEEKGITLENLLLTGHSAGAHLSLLYAYKNKDSSPITPQCVVSYCGPTDLTDENFYIDNEFNVKLVYLFSNLTGKTITVKNHTKKKNILSAASPINYVTKDSVPTVICHGTLDDIVPYTNATRLQAKLNEYNVKNILITFQNSGHGLENDLDASNYASVLMHEFVELYLKKPGIKHS